LDVFLFALKHRAQHAPSDTPESVDCNLDSHGVGFLSGGRSQRNRDRCYRVSGIPAESTPRFVREIDTLIRARYPLLYLVSWEEQRVDGIIAELARAHGKALFDWSVTRGLKRHTQGRPASADETREPLKVLEAVARI